MPLCEFLNEAPQYLAVVSTGTHVMVLFTVFAYVMLPMEILIGGEGF